MSVELIRSEISVGHDTRLEVLNARQIDVTHAALSINSAEKRFDDVVLAGNPSQIKKILEVRADKKVYVTLHLTEEGAEPDIVSVISE